MTRPHEQETNCSPGTCLIRPVLAALDLSATSLDILISAAKLADQEGRPLVILHAVHDPAHAPGLYRQKKNGPLQTFNDIAQSRMSALLLTAQNRHPEIQSLVDPDLMIRPGLPQTTITRMAKMTNAAMVITGHRRQSPIARWWRGSVSDQVARSCERPVLFEAQ